METLGPTDGAQLERIDVAYCLATEIVRVKRAAAQLRRANAQARDMSPLLTQPLEAVAEQLGLVEAVNALVRAALPGTVVPAPVPVPAPPLPADADDLWSWPGVRGTNGTRGANGASPPH